jgi:hypothetical protein
MLEQAMKPKLLLCLALVLSGGLFGCTTITNNHAAALPMTNTTNGLVPLFDMAMSVSDYAVAIATDRQQGTVYEIGWQRVGSVGSGHAEYGRRIYLWNDGHNHWHFLGEGPEEGWERAGGQTVESKVVWGNPTTNGLPFQIRLHFEQTTSPYNINADADTNSPRYVTICNDSALVGEFPTTGQPVGNNPYLLAEKGDTLEKITLRLGYFHPGWNAWPDEAKQQAEKKRILEAWRAVIVRLNPKLPTQGKINAGTRVDLEMINR